MADPFATPTDLAARWRALTLDETDRATTLLADASSKMRNFCRGNGRNLDTALAADELDTDTAKRIACGMVKRSMSAPAGVPEAAGQAQQSAGPFRRLVTCRLACTYFIPAPASLVRCRTQKVMCGSKCLSRTPRRRVRGALRGAAPARWRPAFSSLRACPAGHRAIAPEQDGRCCR